MDERCKQFMSSLLLDTHVLDLGHDQERMTETDADRQVRTVNRLLASFYGSSNDKCEVQLLADEVGLGKTYVALAVAHTTLAALRQSTPPPQIADVRDGYRAVVVVTPQGNHALAEKWTTEVGAMVSRCGRDQAALSWFKSVRCYTPEDLLIALRKASDRRRKPGTVPTVLICEVGIFTKRIRESGAKLRFLSAALFQWLGNAVPHEVRRHVIRRAAEVPGYERLGRRSTATSNELNCGISTRTGDICRSMPTIQLRYEFDDWSAFETVPFTYDEMRLH